MLTTQSKVNVFNYQIVTEFSVRIYFVLLQHPKDIMNFTKSPILKPLHNSLFFVKQIYEQK